MERNFRIYRRFGFWLFLLIEVLLVWKKNWCLHLKEMSTRHRINFLWLPSMLCAAWFIVGTVCSSLVLVLSSIRVGCCLFFFGFCHYLIVYMNGFVDFTPSDTVLGDWHEVKKERGCHSCQGEICNADQGRPPAPVYCAIASHRHPIASPLHNTFSFFSTECE